MLVANGTGLLNRDDDHYQTNFEDGQGCRRVESCKNCWNTWKCIRCFYLFKCDCIRTNRCNYNLWNRGTLGQTIISVTDASTINVGDIVNFGETFEYETTARNTTSNEITIKIIR